MIACSLLASDIFRPTFRVTHISRSPKTLVYVQGRRAQLQVGRQSAGSLHQQKREEMLIFLILLHLVKFVDVCTLYALSSLFAGFLVPCLQVMADVTS